MANLIERQAAIDALDGNVIVTSRESAQAVMDYIRDCADRIRSLPSAQQERKTGRWIHREDMDFLDENKVKHIHFMCSECGLIHDFLDGHTSQYNYCPNCGAKME